jgi:hypothetical protein
MISGTSIMWRDKDIDTVNALCAEATSDGTLTTKVTVGGMKAICG